MPRFQITGLPGSGKSTALLPWKADVIDLADFVGRDREQLFEKACLRKPNKLYAESACGTSRVPSYVVRLSIPAMKLYENLKRRGEVVDPDYLSLLTTQMIKPDITVSSTDDLRELLNRLS